MIGRFLVFILFTFILSGCLGEGENEESSFSGKNSYSIIHDGMERTWKMYVPSSHYRGESSPLLILLHGGGSTGEGMAKLTRGGLDELAEKEGFIVVYPDAVENHWNDGRGLIQYKAQNENVDDVGFISDLIDHLHSRLNIDRHRVYVAGISNGGMMAQTLACELAEKITAVAVVSSAMSENLHSYCNPSQPIPILLISGTDDPLIPFRGGEIEFFGRNYGTVLSVPETKEFWVAHNGCSIEPVITKELDREKDGTSVRKETYDRCRGDAEVVLYIIEGGGHTWPGGLQYSFDRIIGKTSKDIDANIIIWDFFKLHSLGNGSEETIAGQSTVPGGIFNLEIFSEEGGRTSWLRTENLIAYDRGGEDHLFDVFVMNLDSTGQRCLTCQKGAVPQLHNGNPCWHPSGEYIVFQSQDPGLGGLPGGRLGDYFASPGIGINNNLWITDAGGTRFWQITHVKEGYGTLHPQFSPDGKKLLWSEVVNPRGSTGHWVMKLADFAVENGEPRVSNVRTLKPLGLMFYETHGFSTDGEKIIFSGIEEGGYYYDMEIFITDTKTGKTVRLTDNDEWDEHAHFTPDGNHIVWTSSEGIPQIKCSSWQDTLDNPPLFEYWIMNADGTGKRRLSGFNDFSSPDYMNMEGGVGLGDFDFSCDGKSMVAKLRKGRGGEMLVLLTIASPIPTIGEPS